MPQLSVLKQKGVLSVKLLLLLSPVYSVPFTSFLQTAYIDPAASSHPSNLNTSAKTSIMPPSPAAPVVPSLTAQWIPLAKDTQQQEQHESNSKFLPRSGHVSFVLNQKEHYVFGGYIEEASKDGTMMRYPSKELWKRTVVRLDGEEQDVAATAWKCVKEEKEEESSDDAGDWPEERLCSAVAVLNGSPHLFGGWNPNNRQQGSEILDTIHTYHPTTQSWTNHPSLSFPDGPTSRHIALPLPSNPSLALLHNHRCDDFVYLYDPTSAEFTKQKTKGVGPSSRGLHAACGLGKSFVVVFGGAAQNGTMSNEVFLLNTLTWEWKMVEFPKLLQEQESSCPQQPHVRAAPNLVAFNETCVILYGGAKATEQGLEPLSDVWALYLNRFSGEGTWEELISNDLQHKEEGDGTSRVMPPGRNAATLTEIHRESSMETEESSSSSSSLDRSKLFLLHGGWAPFRKTFLDDFVLRVSPKED